MRTSPISAETAGAAVVSILGIVATTYGAFAHVAQLSAPGSTAILLGGAWLGSALARRGVQLFPSDAEPEGQAE